MILAVFALIPALLWDQGPQTAPDLDKAGIHEIATTGDAAAWAGTGVNATALNPATLVHAEPPGVDYQVERAGATAMPWINSNLWREFKARDKAFLYEVSGAAVKLAVAEAYASGAQAYLRIKPEDLDAFASAVRFLRELDGPHLAPRVNFGLVDDGSGVLEEVMNLLIRRNLLFEPVHSARDWKGMVVQVGTPGYTKEMAGDPFQFAAIVRSRIGDDRRLVRIFGSDTTVVRLFGDEIHARLELIQYGRNPVTGLRVRVLGHYRRVLISALGRRVTQAEDTSTDDTATEFTIPEFDTCAIVDLDSAEPGILTSLFSDHDFALTADPSTPEWKTAPVTTAPRDVFGDALPMAPTQIRSRWTKDSLYLLYVCPYRSLNLKADPVTGRDTPQLWDWDVAEAFIGADSGPIGQYREYQVSPQGEQVDLEIDVEHPKPEGGIGWNSGFEVKARMDAPHKIWYGEMRIPLASIRSMQYKSGDRLRLGLFRITGLPAERTPVAWQPSFRHNFHVPEAFGTLVLGQSDAK